MMDYAFAFAFTHPLLFVAALCAVGAGAALLIVPHVREEMHRIHPRC